MNNWPDKSLTVVAGQSVTDNGFQVANTNLNAMVMPGHVTKITQKFDKPGKYLVLCNEYCGAGHQVMSTTITVK